MHNKVNFTVWLGIGILVTSLAGLFSIGSKGDWEYEILDHYWELLILRTLFFTFLGTIYSVVSFFLYRAFADSGKRLSFLKFHQATIPAYFITALMVTLYFLWSRK